MRVVFDGCEYEYEDNYVADFILEDLKQILNDYNIKLFTDGLTSEDLKNIGIIMTKISNEINRLYTKVEKLEHKKPVLYHYHNSIFYEQILEKYDNIKESILNIYNVIEELSSLMTSYHNIYLLFEKYKKTFKEEDITYIKGSTSLAHLIFTNNNHK